jgi:class 3 adenylate cyclase/tetratricopeptide (TPR) repeat protein
VGDRSKELVTYLPASVVHAYQQEASLTVPWCRHVDGTMVMADLSGFTSISERLARLGDEGAERLTTVINSFFERMLKTAAFFGGDTLTFGGDAILLLFQGEDHADRAVAAALGMLKQVERAAAVDAGDEKVKIGMSVGAHSDSFLLAAAGLPETEVRAMFLGRGAESAALAEAQADRGQVAVSPPTRKLLTAPVRTRKTGEYWRVTEFDAKNVCPLDPDETALSEQQAACLAPFLPPYADEILAPGPTYLRLTPEHRRVAIVFVNILGLSELIERDGPEGALEQLQNYVSMLTLLSEKHRGFVVSSDIATKGSKLVLTFGAPIAHEYAATNAARFALDLNAWLRDSRLGLQHRIGVNGGHVFAGEVGPAFRRQYTVMGDAVNLAARLMAAASAGEVYVSRDLLETAGPSLCGRELPPMKVKGKEKPVAVCVLEEEKAVERQVYAWGRAGRARRRLFGRRRELALIHEKWAKAQDGSGSALLVEGDAGVGKTRLIEEALRALPREAVVTRAACFEHLQAAPLTPWTEALLGILNVARDDPVERRTARVQDYLEAHLPDLKEFGPLLNPLLNLALPQSPMVDALDVQSRREKLFELITGMLTVAAGGAAHVIVLEDLHWMDDSSIALAGYMAGQTHRTTIMLLLTTRPMDVPRPLEQAGVQLVSLAELTEAESLSMVREALGVKDLPDEVGEAVYAKTKGNPLFLEEVIHSLQTPGLLDRILSASSVTRSAELATLEIPDRVQGLLMSRIDALPADTRAVLKAGSVVGRSFDGGTLEGIEDEALGDVSLDRAFDELINAALVVPTEGFEEGTSVTFRHALVQDVAYESLPFSRRRDLHGRIARYLEASQASPDHPLLVHHYRNAGDDEETLVHSVFAARDSGAAGASLEAVDYLELGLTTVRGCTPRAACLRSRIEELMGESLEFARPRDAADAFIRARRRWGSLRVRRVSEAVLRDVAPIEDHPSRESLLCWKAAMSLARGLSEYKRSLRWHDKATVALPPDRTELAARILYGKAAALFRLGRMRESMEAGREAVELAQTVEDPTVRGFALVGLANAYDGLGMLQEGEDCLVKAVELFEQGNDIVGHALAHSNLGYTRYLSGDFRACLEHSETALSLYARAGSVSGMANMHMNIAGMLGILGEMDRAMEHYQAIACLEEQHPISVYVAGHWRLFLAITLAEEGDLDGSERTLAEAKRILDDLDSAEYNLEISLADVRLGLARRDYRSVEPICRSAVEQARSMGAGESEAEALCVLGLLRLGQDDPSAAVECFEESVTLAGRIGANYERARALAGLAEAKAACLEGDPACEDLLSEAIKTFERMGAARELREALELRERLSSALPAWSPGKGAAR